MPHDEDEMENPECWCCGSNDCDCSVVMCPEEKSRKCVECCDCEEDE